MPSRPQRPRPLDSSFFARDACVVARDLVGKVLRRRFEGVWLAAAVIEAEAYYKGERGSHASLGRTKSREALFMPAGTIYMYHSRGGDSLNVSCLGEGNAILVKSGVPFFDARSPEKETLPVMQRLNPAADGGPRPASRQCAGQTLLCRSLSLKIRDWDRRNFDPRAFYVEDVGYRPERVIVTRRLGIPAGRDEHLLYRYVDAARLASATQNPLTRRSWREGEDYFVLDPDDEDPNAGGPSRAPHETTRWLQ